MFFLLEAPASSPTDGMALVLAMMVVMIVFTMRSNSKRRKEQESLEGSLSKGMKVITAGGLHGTIHKCEDTTVVIVVDKENRTKMTFSKSAVSTVLSDQDKGKSSK